MEITVKGGIVMSTHKAPSDVQYDDEGKAFIFRMSITKNGKKIFRKNGRPFKIYLN